MISFNNLDFSPVYRNSGSADSYPKSKLDKLISFLCIAGSPQLLPEAVPVCPPNKNNSMCITNEAELAGTDQTYKVLKPYRSFKTVRRKRQIPVV